MTLLRAFIEDTEVSKCQCIYVDSLVTILVSFHVLYLIQRVSLDRFHTVEGDAPHLQLVLHLIKND